MQHRLHAFIACLAVSAVGTPVPALAWQPTRPIEFVVPAGTGGGADQMARVIQGIVAKYALTPTPMVVINRAGGAGAEGLLDVKASRGNPHKLIITLSNLFTTPLATGVPFNWKDITPIAMVALDEFVLWVNAGSPHRTVGEYVAAIQAGAPNQFRMGGTGARQEDHIITVAIEHHLDVRFTYVPFRGGGEVAAQLADGLVDSTVNNPIEAVAQWRAGKLRPLCVFDTGTLPAADAIAGTLGWSDIPTCASQGLDVAYLMLRGIFGAPDLKPEQVAYYVTLLNRVREAPEWRQLMHDGAFNQSFMTGAAFSTWLDTEEKRHRALMGSTGFLAGN